MIKGEYMNKKIFLLYLKNQSIDTSFRSVFKEFSWFQKACAVTYLLLCLSIVVLIIIGVFVNETVKYIFIPLILFVIPYICLSISLKKQKDLSQEIKDRFDLINELTEFLETYGINNKEKVEIFHDRMRNSLNEHLDGIRRTKDAITSVFKVLIIPAFLVILTQLFADSANLTEALAYSTLSFIKRKGRTA